MRKIKMEKGITLIALIITIVVLLILAAVTIGAVQESDIMSKGKYAADEYNKAKESEGSVLLGYQSFIESNLPGGQLSGGNNDGDDNNDDDNSGNNGGNVEVEDDVVQGEGMDGVILNSTANSIPNGTYYYLGQTSEDTSFIVSDNGYILRMGEYDDYPVEVTINNGEVTATYSEGESGFVLKGNYYETINNNKILIITQGEFETSERKKNRRGGYLFAINANDLKYDIEGTFLAEKTNRITFTKGSNVAVRTYSGNSTGVRENYAGFEDMFYLNEYQIRYIGLEEGFSWDGNGLYRRES